MTAVLLSLILGFMLGVKFYGQVVNRCTLSSRNSDSFDGPKNRTIKGVKYTKSPPRDENFTGIRNASQSKRNLSKQKGESIERNDDSDSNSSTAGKIVDESGDNFTRKSNSPFKSLSPSISVDKFWTKNSSKRMSEILMRREWPYSIGYPHRIASKVLLQPQSSSHTLKGKNILRMLAMPYLHFKCKCLWLRFIIKLPIAN